jgi:phosphoglucosamine mutase
MKRLFGTDGIRAIAGTPPLDPPSVRKFGLALAKVLAGELGRPPRVVCGRDTRESGPWLRDAVADGLAACGGTMTDAGVITTPGLAHATQAGLFDAGVMISASHNPFEDNGLKVFSRDGMKLEDAMESRIETIILDPAVATPPEGAGRAMPDEALVSRYVQVLESAVPAGRFRGLRLFLDCANGSASAIAPAVFRHLGAAVETQGDAPNGRNINLGCGSLHLDGLAARVREGGFDLGLAFDGDADRCLVVDRTGRVLDGDFILYVEALRLQRRGALPGSAVVATVMSNLWLEKKLADAGIRLLRTPVGDKYVLERMMAEGSLLGGEQSGHVIFLDRCRAGDGILTGLRMAEALVQDSLDLAKLADGIERYPQVLVNIKVTSKPPLETHPEIGPAIRQAESSIAGEGRVLVRYSGTERMVRVMVEGKSESAIQAAASLVVEAIRKTIGAV